MSISLSYIYDAGSRPPPFIKFLLFKAGVEIIRSHRPIHTTKENPMASWKKAPNRDLLDILDPLAAISNDRTADLCVRNRIPV